MSRSNEQSLGVARGKRVYDLPLNRASGAGFLVLLIALMTFLALLALASSFALSAMTDRWSSGLESKVTVEIPATDERGASLKHEDVRQKTEQIADMLRQHPSVVSVHSLTDQEIGELVKPWLGDNLQLANVPMPGLISLQMKNEDQTTYKVLTDRVAAIEPRARVDTHEDWLKDVIRFTNALQFATALLTIVIGFTTATAMGGAVRARMAVNRDEIEILHLMGAADAYISRQFQRHSLILGLQGGAAGVAAGMLTLGIIGWMAGRMEAALVPGFSLQIWQIGALLCLPLLAAAISVTTTTHTVKAALLKLP